MKIIHITFLRGSFRAKLITTIFLGITVIFVSSILWVITWPKGFVGVHYQVKTSEELVGALNVVRPGDVITLAKGRYRGEFVIRRSGTAERKITLEGPADAVIENPSRAANDYEVGFGLHVKASHWLIRGFSIKKSLKGIIVDGGNFNTLKNLSIIRMDDEGIHFRYGSSNNQVVGCFINDTGRVRPGFGEGIYIGQDHKKWPGGKPDRTDRNDMIGNTFGSAVRGECIDVKEGTCCGRIAWNYFDGRGQTNKKTDDNWVDVKGDMYVIEDNIGWWSLRDGFGLSDQHPIKDTHSACGNLFRRNRCEFQVANTHGYCVSCNNGCPCSNVIQEDNIVINGIGLTNVPW